MLSEIEIWRSARLVVDQHGDKAIATAESRAKDLLNKGDQDGWVTWTRIAAAILEVQRANL